MKHKLINSLLAVYLTANLCCLVSQAVTAGSGSDISRTSNKVGKAPSWLAPYNIEWTEPGKTAVESMPIGGGNLGLNVWTTQDELLFYIGSSDSWNGSRQVKIGRVRIILSPNPFVGEFSQKLDLATNSIDVHGRAADGTVVDLHLWVDALQPVVHVEGKASRPVKVTAAIELIGGSEGRFDGATAAWRFRVSDGPSPQHAKGIAANRIQAIATAVPDPMANHTWGGRLSGAGFVADQTGEMEEPLPKDKVMKSRYLRLTTKEPVTRIDLRATLRIDQDPTVEAWEKAVTELEAKTLTTSAADRAKTEAWWRAFWDRSHIVINSGKNVADPAWEAGRNYQLFRAMLGTNSSGRMPTLFNGGHFLFEADPNERLWGHAGFTAQNQRLVYWPMLKSGDLDLLKVGLDFYLERYGLAKAWAQHFWKIDGAVYPEDIEVFGLPAYGANSKGHTSAGVLSYHYVSGMEFALMMLQSGSYFRSDISKYVPIADGMLRFFDQFYRDRDKDGRLVISPGGSLEAYQGTTNDAPTIAGLMALSEALLHLPTNLVTAEQRTFWKAFRLRLPPLPTQMGKGERCLAPAMSWEAQRPDANMELPQLYPVFPFYQYGVGLPDLDLARNAWFDGYTSRAKQKNHFCWYQGGNFCAGLGLALEARDYALAKFLHPRFPNPAGGGPWKLKWAESGWVLPRYPAFWDAMNWCARPDMDHGGAAMVQLQEMLLQTPGDQLNLFPAWPKDWDVDFKLHAPRQTTVEGILRSGKLVSLKVTPTSRMKDVVNWLDRKELAAVSPVILSLNRPAKASSTSEKRGFEAWRATDDDVMSGWTAAPAVNSAWLEIDLGKERDISHCWLSESEDRFWPIETDRGNIREFTIEAKEDSEWKELARGTNIGADKVIKFAPYKARYVRLNIIKSAGQGPIHINEFQVFAP
jgi:hypothetical protein